MDIWRLMLLLFCNWCTVSIQHYFSFRYATQWSNNYILKDMLTMIGVATICHHTKITRLWSILPMPHFSFPWLTFFIIFLLLCIWLKCSTIKKTIKDYLVKCHNNHGALIVITLSLQVNLEWCGIFNKLSLLDWKHICLSTQNF